MRVVVVAEAERTSGETERADDDVVMALRDVWRTLPAEPPVDAVRDVTLDIARGEWWSIEGPSGSGKSTLLHVLGCLDRATKGTYLLDGLDVADMSDRELAGVRAGRIGFVFQQFHLLPHRSVHENVMLASMYVPSPQRASGRSERAQRAERARDVIDRVGLSARLDFLPTRLSGGERQRVAIARALMNRPPVLLCDEPTGNLDSANTAGVLDLLGELNDDGQTVVVVTHDGEVSARGTRTARMADGRLEVVR